MPNLTHLEVERAARVLRTIARGGIKSEQLLEHVRLRDPKIFELVQQQIEAGATDPNVYFGRYTLVAPCGHGRDGVNLWQGKDLDGTKVAIKIYDPEVDPDELSRIKAVYEAVRWIEHSNVARVFDLGRHPFDASFCVVTEWIEGGTLADQVGQSETARLAEWVRQLAAAINDVFRNTGVVHGDLKPTNVMIAPNGAPKIIDWDDAVLLGSSGRAVRMTRDCGTPGTAAPEQACGGKMDHRTDVYGLGAILYFCAHGKPPIELRANPDPDWRQQAKHLIPDLPERGKPNDEQLRRVTQKCLRKSPANRYATSAELERDLFRFSRGEPVSAPRSLPWRHRPREFVARYPTQTQLTVHIVLAMAMFATVVTFAAAIAGQYLSERERAARESQAGLRASVLRELEELKDSAQLREKAALVTKADPNDLTMHLVPVSLDLLAAATPEQHVTIPQQVDAILRGLGATDTQDFVALFQNLAKQHELLVQLVNHGFGGNPSPRQELQQLEESARALLDTKPTLAECANLPPLRRLLETIRVFNETANRNDKPPEPYDKRIHPALYWIYWQTVELDRRDAAGWCAELHYQRACGRFAMLCVPVFQFDDAQRAARQADGYSVRAVTTLRAAVLAQSLRQCWGNCQEAVNAPMLTRNSLLTVKCVTLGMTAAMTLVRLVPKLEPKEIDDALQSATGWRERTDSAPLDVQLFSRVVLIESLCESDVPDHWRDDLVLHGKRVESFRNSGATALDEWERSETTTDRWPSRKKEAWSSDFIRMWVTNYLSENGHRTEAEQVRQGQLSPLEVSSRIRGIADKRFQDWHQFERDRFRHAAEK